MSFYISNYLNWIHTIIIFIVFQNLHLNKTCIERMIICGSWFGRSFLLVNFFFVSCWFVANTTKCILRFHTLDHLYQSSWMNIYIHLFLIISLTSTWFFGPLKAEKINRITNCEICLLSAINLPREKDFLNRIKYLNIILMRILFQLNVVFIDRLVNTRYHLVITLVIKTINKAKTRRKIWTKTFHASKNNIQHPSSPEIRFLSCIKIFVHLMSVLASCTPSKKVVLWSLVV